MVKENSNKAKEKTSNPVETVAPFFQVLYQDEPLKLKLSRQETSPMQQINADITKVEESVMKDLQ
jgi:hypothetical protein